MPKTFSFEFGEEHLQASADRTLWWEKQKTIFMADLHAGKAEHMQRAGLPVPSGNLKADLDRLDNAATSNGAQRVVILGDLFHSELNDEWDIWSDWCRTRNYSVELVRGNHDRFITDQQFMESGLIVRVEPEPADPFELRHHPAAATDQPVICGHVHPVMSFFPVQLGTLFDSPVFGSMGTS